MQVRGMLYVVLAVALDYIFVNSVSASAVPAANSASSNCCRHIPGDAGWPSRRDWARLNSTVGGRLVATVPLAHVCHETGPFAAYDAAACDGLRENFLQAGPATMLVIPAVLLANPSMR